MKPNACEICGGTHFREQDGMYVCEYCEYTYPIAPPPQENVPVQDPVPEKTSAPAPKKTPAKSTKKSGRTGRRILYYGLLCAFAAVFIGSAVYLGSYLVESYQANSEYSDMAAIMASIREAMATATSPSEPSQPRPTDPSTGETLPTESTAPTEPVMLEDLKYWYDQNSDTVGWIEVPDTKIAYPVMQTPNSKDYYLKRNFNKKSSDWGAIYVREVCNVFEPSDNLTIYGHHMKDGSMFSGLDKYKKQSFWEDHQIIYFDTLYERHTYQVFAVFKTSANASEGFSYHHFVDAANEEEFNAYISTVKSLAFYETGITAEYGDKLITLSTCEYTLDNGRFVVVAKRIS